MMITSTVPVQSLKLCSYCDESYPMNKTFDGNTSDIYMEFRTNLLRQVTAMKYRVYCIKQRCLSEKQNWCSSISTTGRPVRLITWFRDSMQNIDSLHENITFNLISTKANVSSQPDRLPCIYILDKRFPSYFITC